jgi:type II secretory pathway pseudopilin PulG
VSINFCTEVFFVRSIVYLRRSFMLVLLLSLAILTSLGGRSQAQATSSSNAAQDSAAAAATQSTASQQSKQDPASTQPADKDPIQPTTQNQSKASGTSKDRLFFALPNFLTLENAGQVPPLTTKQKFAVVARGSFDYVQYPWYGFLSGISQWEDSEPGYGQGAEGYAKRFGAAFADGTIENFFTGAIFPSVLHQDPRYFQLGHGSFMHRTLYAMSRNLITRTDSGKNQFNFSEVVGGALAAGISTYSYHPKSHVFSTPNPPYYRFVASDRTLDNTLSVWGTQYGYDTLTLVVKEFWPDIRRKVRHQPKVAAAEPSTSSH